MSKIKRSYGERILKKKMSSVKRNVKVCNINDAKNVGIFFNATHFVSFEIVRDLAKKLTQKGIKVSVLGYVESDKLIDHYLYRKGFDFFTKKELNWYNKPVSDSVDKFIRKPFDILINLTLEDIYPVKYILGYSVSSFKVGRYTDNHEFLDLMIDLEKEKKEMQNIKNTLKNEQTKNQSKKELEELVERKADIEIQLNFLISQLLHYLSILKN